LDVLLPGRRVLVVDDCFVDRRIEALAFCAYPLNAETA
jgi:hypothetical protein